MPSTKIFNPRRVRLGLLGALLPALPLIAQNASPPNATESSTVEEPVQMSAFEVRTTQGKGYSEGNLASALKSSSDAMEIPQDILIVTSDLISDIGATNSSDTLMFAGVGTYYRGPAIMVRGSRVGNPYLDDVPISLPAGVSDNVNIDSYEVIKGPVQFMYPGASLGGLVLEASKKPLPAVQQYIVTAQVNQFGGNRETFDLNTPVGHLGDGTLTFRMVGVYQSPFQIFYNVPEQHTNIYPDLEWDWKGTTVILSYDAQILIALPGGASILTPTGDLYTGDGRRVEGAPPNDSDRDEQHDARVAWIQKLSDSWENKFQAVFENFLRYGVASHPTNINYNTNMVTYYIRLDDEFSTVVCVQDDMEGKYDIGPLPNQSLVGFNHTEATTGPDYFPLYNVNIPIGSPAAINSIVLPFQLPASVLATAVNSRQESYTDDIYYMHQIDIVPNWLSLNAGFTFSKIESINDTNTAIVNPYNATDLNGHDLLHRLALVFHVSKDLMLYGAEETTFSPSSGTTYLDAPLPNVLGKDDEIGLKTSFLNGKLSSSFALYNMTLTNQSVLVGGNALNIVGNQYYQPIGTTHYRGWEGNMALTVIPGLQVIAAGYDGSIEDQNGNPISQTFDDQWDVWARYDCLPDSTLKGLAIGGGVVRQGGRYFSMSGITLPGAAPLPVNSSGASLFKLHEGTQVNAFISYAVNRHLSLVLSCDNLLDSAYPLGVQGVGDVDPSDPTTYTLQMAYKF